MGVLPLIAWRRRVFNDLADALANAAMDRGGDFCRCEQSAVDVQPGDVLQWHSDGGYREKEGKAGAGVSLTLLRGGNGSIARRLLYARAVNLDPHENSLKAELIALETAMYCHHRFFSPSENLFRLA